MSAQAWSIFRRIRILIFLLALILSILWVVFYVLLIAQDWEHASNLERGLVIALIAINFFAAMFWYLMIVLLFQPKAEAVRIFTFIVIQTGGTIAFAIFRNRFPCRVFNTRSSCEMAASVVVYGGWGVSGASLLYLFFLALMSYIELPSRDSPHNTAFDHLEAERGTIEASGGQPLLDESMLKTENQVQDTTLSMPSAAEYSSLTFALRPQSVRTSEYYFPSRPDSTYSASSRYLRPPERGASFDDEAIAGPSSTTLELSEGLRMLPNPFDEPILRDPTPASDSSSLYGYGVGQGKRTLPRRPEEMMFRTPSGRSETLHPPPPYANDNQIAIASDKSQLVVIPRPKGPLRSRSVDLPHMPAPFHRGVSIHSTAGSFHPTVSLPPTPSQTHSSTHAGLESPPLPFFQVMRTDSPTLPSVPEVPVIETQVMPKSPLQRHRSMPTNLPSQHPRPSNTGSGNLPTEEWQVGGLDTANDRILPS